jgi:hypothetical protein
MSYVNSDVNDCVERCGELQKQINKLDEKVSEILKDLVNFVNSNKEDFHNDTLTYSCIQDFANKLYKKYQNGELENQSILTKAIESKEQQLELAKAAVERQEND